MKKKILNVLKFLGFLSIGVFIILWFWFNLSDEHKKQFWTSLQSADYIWIVVAVLLGTISHMSRALRWRLLFEPIGYTPSRKNLFFAVMSMYFGNMFITRLGEVARCAVLQRYEKIPFEKSFGTVVAERAVDLLMLMLLMGITILIQLDNVAEIWENVKQVSAKDPSAPVSEPSFFMKNLKYFIAGFFVLAIGILYLLRKTPFFGKIFSKVKQLAKGFGEGLRSVTRVRKPVAFLLHTFFIWGMYFVMMYVCFFALPETAKLSLLAPLYVLVFGSIAITVVPNGVGAFPMAVAAILAIKAFGNVDMGTGYALGWIIWIGQTALILLVGGISVAALPLVNKGK